MSPVGVYNGKFQNLSFKIQGAVNARVWFKFAKP